MSAWARPHILFGAAMVALFAGSILLAYFAELPEGPAGAYVLGAFAAISNIIAVIAGLLYGERGAREEPPAEAEPDPTLFGGPRP